MKKILEVLQYGEGDIRFNTDLTVNQLSREIPSITADASIAMATNLWGGNEKAVLAVIRALAVADLSLCFNRKEMIKNLDENSLALAKCFKAAQHSFEKSGGKVITFGPGIAKPTGDC